MKTSRTLVKIISVALVICMMLSFVSCDMIKKLFGGSLKLESFTVDRSSVKTEYFIGEAIDFSGIKAVAKYNDESLNKEYTAAELKVTYPEDITATVGQKDVTVSFQDPNLDREQSTTVQIVVIEDPNAITSESFKIDASEVKKFYNLGETVSFDGLKLVEVMSDKSEHEVADLTGLTHEDVTTLTASAGTKSVKFTYNDTPVGIVVIRVLDPADTRNNVTDATVGGEYKAVYEVGESLTITGVTVTVYYESGDPVVLTADKLTLADGVDMSKPGDKNVKVVFTDANGIEDYTYFTVTVVEKDEVLGFTEPQNIIAFKSDNSVAGTITDHNASGFSGQFAKGGQIYKIGDDNEFKMVPALTIRDTDGLPSEPITRYYSDVELYADFGSGYVQLTKRALNQTHYAYYYEDELLATVDTYNGAYKFEKPISKVKIEVLPSADRYMGAKAKTPVILEAEVIDAYNVTEAWQLGLIEYNFEGDRRAMWDSFKLSNGLAKVNDEGAVEHLFVNGIVLHNDIELTADDVPQDYFYVSTKDVRYVKTVNDVTEEKVYPAGTRYLVFRKHIFSRTNTDFVLEGNFFTIDVSKFPTVATPTVVDDSKISAGASENSLFQFHNEWEVTGPEATINNLMFIGNAARDNWVADNGSKESTELLSAGGIQLVRAIENGVVNCNNVISNSCYINYMADWHGTVNVNHSKTYDAFQNAVFVSRNSTFTAEDSYFIGTGGPVVIAQSEYVNNGEYVYKAANATFTGCVLETSLVGDELWFKSLNASEEVMKIAALGNGVNQIISALTKNTEKEVKVNWTKKEGDLELMNIMTLLMRSGGIESMADGMVMGSMTIDGVGVDRNYNFYDATVTRWEMIMQTSAYQSGKQLLTVYDADGTAHTVYFDLATEMLYDLSGTAIYASAEAAGFFAAIDAADVLFLDYGGLSITLELYHG